MLLIAGDVKLAAILSSMNNACEVNSTLVGTLIRLSDLVDSVLGRPRRERPTLRSPPCPLRAEKCDGMRPDLISITFAERGACHCLWTTLYHDVNGKALDSIANVDRDGQ